MNKCVKWGLAGIVLKAEDSCTKESVQFLDEATSFAAGHRPCYECRRREAVFFAELWGETLGGGPRAKAGEIDATLHAERLKAEGRKATYKTTIEDLPTGAMVRWRDGAYLILAGRLLRWAPEGYTAVTSSRKPRCSDVIQKATLQ